jgi:hypothetical protein
MLQVIKFEQKPKHAEPQVNTALVSMLAELYGMASTGELRSFAVVGTTDNRDVVMSYVTDPTQPDVFRLIGLMEACKVRMMDEGVEYDGQGE